jgi:hypothetical protein
VVQETREVVRHAPNHRDPDTMQKRGGAMRKSIDETTDPPTLQTCRPTLTAELASRIEAALARVGAFGEVRLVVVKGRVRFIETLRSEEAGRNGDRREALE